MLLLSCSSRQKEKQPDQQYFEITDIAPKDTLFRVSKDNYVPGDSFGYVNQKGETIIPYGRFTQSFTDTIFTYGIVLEQFAGSFDLIGINQQGQRLYEVLWFDNGPDYLEEGVFRILRDGKIGYADTTGRIVIEAQFECAEPFADGKARVSYNCDIVKDGEHTMMKSDSWFDIDKNGEEPK
ncbi:MAG: WG repeat-containing protein [Saprospiraceae bacterium]|nr:WG repeat-containing protein [Saprospiraceae bacterium]